MDLNDLNFPTSPAELRAWATAAPVPGDFDERSQQARGWLELLGAATPCQHCRDEVIADDDALRDALAEHFGLSDDDAETLVTDLQPVLSDIPNAYTTEGGFCNACRDMIDRN